MNAISDGHTEQSVTRPRVSSQCEVGKRPHEPPDSRSNASKKGIGLKPNLVESPSEQLPRRYVNAIGNKLLSPAVPGLLVLHGMLFALAISHYAGLQWSLVKTLIVYGVAGIWVLASWLWNRPFQIVLSPIDLLYGAFVLMVLSSIAVQFLQGQSPQSYWRYVPFLILPYVACRFMVLSDVRRLLALVAITGLCFIPILAAAGWESYKIYGPLQRPVLFNYYHPVLPASILLGSASLVFFSWLLTNAQIHGLLKLGDRRIGLIAIACLFAALTYVAVRSAMIATLGMTVVGVAVAFWIPFRRRAALIAYVLVVAAACLLVFSSQIAYYSKLSEAFDSAAPTEMTERPISSTEPHAFMKEPSASSTEVNTSSVKPNTSATERDTDSQPTRCDAVRAGRDSIAIREVFMKEAITMLNEHPVFGVGAGLFGQHSCLKNIGHAHNTVLHVLAELGIVGGLLFLGLMITSFITLARALRHAGQRSVALGLLLLFGMVVLLDQVQGNYFFSLDFYAFVGAIAALRSPFKRASVASKGDANDGVIRLPTDPI